MKLVPKSVTLKIGRAILKSKKNSPHMFFAVGVVGVVGAAVLASKATLKLDKTLDDIKTSLDDVKLLADQAKDVEESTYSDREYYKDLGYVYTTSAVKLGQLYGPALIVGGLSIAALTGSHIQLTKRNQALTFTLAAVSKAYNEYRARVREELGDERECDIYHNVTEETHVIDGKKKLVKTVDVNGLSPYARYFDENSVYWQHDSETNRLFLNCQQNHADQLLKSRGHIFLNEVYDSLGLSRTPEGAIVGWLYGCENDPDTGDGYVDFGLYDLYDAEILSQNSGGYILDFNVDGPIFKDI